MQQQSVNAPDLYTKQPMFSPQVKKVNNFKVRAQSNAPAPKPLLISPLLIANGGKPEATSNDGFLQMPDSKNLLQTSSSKNINPHAGTMSGQTGLKPKQPLRGRAKLQLRSGSVPPLMISPHAGNKKDYGIKSQSRKLNYSTNKSNSPENSMAYDDNSSPIRDLNALASFSNIEEVNEDDNHLVQILY